MSVNERDIKERTVNMLVEYFLQQQEYSAGQEGLGFEDKDGNNVSVYILKSPKGEINISSVVHLSDTGVADEDDEITFALKIK